MNAVCKKSVELLNTYEKLANEGLSVKKIAAKLNCTPEWVRSLKLIKALIEKYPILEEFIIADKIAISTIVKSYKEYGDEFINNLNFAEKIAMELEQKTITNSSIARAIKLTTANIFINDEDNDHVALCMSEYYMLQQQTEQRKTEIQCPSQLKESKKIVKQFWQNLAPKINNEESIVDLGCLSLERYLELNNAMQLL